MSKKVILTSIVLFVIVITFAYFKYILGWMEFKKNYSTDKENILAVQVSKSQYKKDSLNLVFCIRNKITKHQNPYYTAVRVNEKLVYINDSLTSIYIDTIFYSSDLKRIAFLTIVNNDFVEIHKRLLKSDSEYLNNSGVLPSNGQEFNGNCFVAERNNKNNLFENISSFSRYSFNDPSSYKNVSKELRENCLSFEKESDKDSKTYNVNDKRFWSSEIWKQ